MIISKLDGALLIRAGNRFLKIQNCSSASVFEATGVLCQWRDECLIDEGQENLALDAIIEMAIQQKKGQ